MRFNESVVGLHPASSGYELEFFVQNNQESDFLSGSGSFFVEFPEFSVTGLEFRGENKIFEPIGPGLQLMEDIEVLENFIQLRCFFSGDLNGFTGLAKENIKKIDIYTGSFADFDPDTVEFTNLLTSQRATVSANSPYLTFDILGEEIDDRVDNIFYKIVPLDYLTFGKSSDSVNGTMFTGFDSVTSIQYPESEVTIDRSNANDLRFYNDGAVVTDVFTGVNISLTNNVPSNFSAQLRIRTSDEDIFITAISGADLRSSDSNFPVTRWSNGLFGDPEPYFDPYIRIEANTGNLNGEFSIESLLDQVGDREAYLVSIA